MPRPEAWTRILDSGLKIEGESLKRPLQGLDRNHPFVEDLKRKDFIATASFTDAQVLGPRFLDRFTTAGKSLDPLNKFIAEAMSLPW